MPRALKIGCLLLLLIPLLLVILLSSLTLWVHNKPRVRSLPMQQQVEQQLRIPPKSAQLTAHESTLEAEISTSTTNQLPQNN